MVVLHPDALVAYLKLHGELRHYASIRNTDALRRAFPWLFRNGIEVLAACGITYADSAKILNVDIGHYKDWMRGRDLPTAKEQSAYLGRLAFKLGDLLSALES